LFDYWHVAKRIFELLTSGLFYTCIFINNFGRACRNYFFKESAMRNWIMVLTTAASLSACGMMGADQNEGMTSGAMGASESRFPGAPSEAPEVGPVGSSPTAPDINPERGNEFPPASSGASDATGASDTAPGVIIVEPMPSSGGDMGTSESRFPGAPSEAPEVGPVGSSPTAPDINPERGNEFPPAQ
jgi:hypothetical protein